MSSNPADLITVIPIDNEFDDDANAETISIGSSIEIRDAAINESWDWTSVQRRLRGAGHSGSAHGRSSKTTRLNIGIDGAANEPLEGGRKLSTERTQQANESWFSGIWRWWNEQTINGRLIKYDEDERSEFIAQRLTRIVGIYLDENTKSELAKLMLSNRIQELLQREDPLAQALCRKYGQRMAEWVALYAQQVEQHRSNKKKKTKEGVGLSKAQQAAMQMKNAALERALQADVDDRLVGNALNDPLMGWFRQRQDVTGRMLARIQNLAVSISQQVAWSFLIEPGRPRTDLSRFYAEFDVLENFFDKVELTAEECSQKAFDANCLFKVRNRKLVCLDWSRIRLKSSAELGQQREGLADIGPFKSTGDIFADDFDAPKTRAEFGHNDFINASRVMGGPLLNEFILTQAPLSQTMTDFWQMVWQERSEWIFQLCESTIDPAENSGILANGSILDQLSRVHCPYYWPRFEGEIMQFGRLFVRNVGIDMASDPLFTITHLVVWMDEGDENNEEEDIPGPSTRSATKNGEISKLRLQHWQWDWRTFTDFHWPFRLLLHSRHSKRPTILMCADGCGRSGTLALIEIFLMQLLRGAVSVEHPMLTAAVFLRLQRRNSVANHMQWLFAYRTVLHWIQPFVISLYHRLVLGFALPNHGFYAKYDEIANSYAHQKGLLI